jgi:hypothetical protein
MHRVPFATKTRIQRTYWQLAAGREQPETRSIFVLLQRYVLSPVAASQVVSFLRIGLLLIMKGLQGVVAFLSFLPNGLAFLSPTNAAGALVRIPSLPTSNSDASSCWPLRMAQVSEQEAKKGIDKVVNALKKDSTANQELGKLEKVTNVLGYGSPSPGSLAVRFNASFKKGGFGRSSVPLPFGLGQSEKSEGRGQMVGQVKASIDIKTGKVTSCSVFRDLGYGRSFNLKV